MDKKNNERKEKIKLALKDQKFIKRISELNDEKEIQKIFIEKNIELTLEEISQLKKLFFKSIKNNGELSDEDLDSVAGGASKEFIDWILGRI